MHFLVLSGGRHGAHSVLLGEGYDLLRQAGQVTIVSQQESTPTELPAEFRDLMSQSRCNCDQPLVPARNPARGLAAGSK